jgi:hypothetical protein
MYPDACLHMPVLATSIQRDSLALGKRFMAQGARDQVREKLRITGTLDPLEQT